MQDFEKLGVFYLGRVYDASSRASSDDLLLYDSRDLVTHAVCVGMTGSGKTGLCIGLLEEAAIDGVPAIVIDPKGDLTNLLLQFPELRPADFRPWINEDDAQREGLSPDEFAASQAQLWSSGLGKWGQDGARIQRMQQAADFSIYTPGSNAGTPVSVMKSFAAPQGEAAEDRELLADRISSTATAVLSLAGVDDLDPLTSREHILVSNLLQKAWAEGQSLDLAGLIQAIQQPPFRQIGVVELSSFFPDKDRFALAMRLNNLLASPGFAAWMEGEPLDIQRMLHGTSGKPRISVVSIAHLSDSERMFFVSLLLNEILTWTRAQPGTTSLRAILYMDEIFGYFPPTANPPSKKPLLTLLKQARAFGVGVVLATQNPVDLDYKGLSNCGTWFIGRLQTERDKNRLLDGLEGAAEGGKFDRPAMEETLAGLGKRVFLMNNVHEAKPVAFETRWCLSYLRGPLTRTQIKALSAVVDSGKETVTEPAAAPKPVGSTAAPRPVLPAEIEQKFLALRGSAEGVLYQPSLMASAQVRYVDTKSGVDQIVEKTYLTPIKDDNMPVQWEECSVIDVHPEELEAEPAVGVAFGVLAPAASKPKSFAGWNKDAITWIFGTEQLSLLQSADVKLISKAGESEGDFRSRVGLALREARDAKTEALRQDYAPKFAKWQDALVKAQAKRDREKAESQAQMLQTAISVGSTLLGAVFGRKVISAKTIQAATSSARSFSRMQQQGTDVDIANASVETIQQKINDLNAEFKAATDQVQNVDATTVPLSAVVIKPKKAAITIRYFALVWAPYRGEEVAW